MTDDDIKFIQTVEAYVQSNPEIVAFAVIAIQRGITRAFTETSERAADMETTAAMALNARLFKGNEKFIADKLEKWKGKSALCWDDQIATLKGKSK